MANRFINKKFRGWLTMKDEDFQRRLEDILSRLYKIDQEIREYLKDQKTEARTSGYGRRSYLKNRDMFPDGKYGPR
jgi:hypothetical protein